MKGQVFCRERVWDNGDMRSCDRAAVRKQLCADHLRERIAELSRKKINAEAEVRRCERELEELRR